MFLTTSSHWSFTGILRNRWGKGDWPHTTEKVVEVKAGRKLREQPSTNESEHLLGTNPVPGTGGGTLLIRFLNPCSSSSTDVITGGTYWTCSTRNWRLREVKQPVHSHIAESHRVGLKPWLWLCFLPLNLVLCCEVWSSPNFSHWLLAIFICPFSNSLIGIFFNVVVQLLSHVQLIVTPWTVAYQASLSFTISQSLFKLMSIESLLPSVYLMLCHPLLLPSVFPSIRVFSNESDLWARWPKCWRFSFNISPSSEYSGLISFRIDCFHLLAVQGILKNLLQHRVPKHQFFGAQPFLLSSSHIHTWLHGPLSVK